METGEPDVRGPLAWPGTGPAPELGDGETHVWRFDLDVPEAETVRLGALLSPDERLRAEAYRRERDGRRYTAGRGRLREILAAYTRGEPRSLALVEGPNGKPELTRWSGSEVRFNLAHSEGLAVCAVSRAEVGVDVEAAGRARRPRWRAVAGRFFHAEELARLDGLADEPGWLEFLRVWTLKEACLKATGLGLVADPRSFSVAAVLAAGGGRVALGDREWRCRELKPMPRAVAALACAAKPSLLRGRAAPAAARRSAPPPRRSSATG